MSNLTLLRSDQTSEEPEDHPFSVSWIAIRSLSSGGQAVQKRLPLTGLWAARMNRAPSDRAASVGGYLSSWA